MVEHWLLPVDDSEVCWQRRAGLQCLCMKSEQVRDLLTAVTVQICESALQWTIKELLEQGQLGGRSPPPLMLCGSSYRLPTALVACRA